MNLYSVLLNDSFALYDAVCATPLEQFQILPLSAQVYPSSAGISSLEMSNLFPQVGGSSEFVYFTSGAGLGASAASLTSWSHQAWLDLYSAVPSYICLLYTSPSPRD